MSKSWVEREGSWRLAVGDMLKLRCSGLWFVVFGSQRVGTSEVRLLLVVYGWTGVSMTTVLHGGFLGKLRKWLHGIFLGMLRTFL